MTITYHHYLHKLVNDCYISQSAIISTRSVRENNVTKFVYNIEPLLDSLIEQSELFANYIFTNSNSNFRLNFYKNDFSKMISIASKAYQYSFLKALHYAIQKSKGDNQVDIPSTSTLFYGHYQMYKTVMAQYVTTTDTFNSSRVDRILSVRDIDLSEFPLYNDIISESFQGKLYSSELENVLNEMKSKGPDFLVFADVRSSDFDSTPENNPLGNACYSIDSNNFKYIPSTSSDSDKTSLFWNKACFITIETESLLPNNDTYYKSIPVELIDDFSLNYEVHSITGFLPTVLMDTDSNSKGSDNGSGSIDPKDPPPVNPLKWNRAKGNNRNSTSTKQPIKPKDGGHNTAGNNQNAFVNNVKNVVGNIWNDDIVKSLILSVAHNNLSQRARAKMIKDIADASKQYKVTMTEDGTTNRMGLPLVGFEGKFNSKSYELIAP